MRHFRGSIRGLVCGVLAAALAAPAGGDEASPTRGGKRAPSRIAAPRTASDAVAAKTSDEVAAKTSDAVAVEVDRRIGVHLAAASVVPAAVASDEDFLRRASLDLAGQVPTPQEVTLFGLDPDADKRARLIDRLLASESYADIWGSYWREVVFSRATEERSRLAQGGFEDWLKEQFRKNTPWDQVTREILTATGSVNEDGRTAFLFAHTGQPPELAAETARIFLGIQIQCANCHDHPTDSWKREQFHQLAAFFPRVSVRREPGGSFRDFVVASADNEPARQREFDPEQVFAFLDQNRDGRLSEAEADRAPQFRNRFQRALERGDADKDGAISLAEFKELPRPDMNQPGRGSAEYYMPDLEDPSARGTLMQPVFFVTGNRLPMGERDLDRRGDLAEFITRQDNPWFARAYVNRIWAEMLGEGFTMPIDDMGPERDSRMPDVLDLLAEGFTANDYDVQWLFRTIARTEAYQRELRHREPTETTPFAAAATTRLRSDQIYNAVTQVLGVTQIAGAGNGMQRGPAMPGGDRARIGFAALFGFDPSTPQEDILGNIPQALFMMNSPILASLIRGDRDTRLGRILREYPDDRDALSELYLLVLSREPTDKEVDICREHLHATGDRTAAFEDILWSLLNSSEFLSKR